MCRTKTPVLVRLACAADTSPCTSILNWARPHLLSRPPPPAAACCWWARQAPPWRPRPRRRHCRLQRRRLRRVQGSPPPPPSAPCRHRPPTVLPPAPPRHAATSACLPWPRVNPAGTATREGPAPAFALSHSCLRVTFAVAVSRLTETAVALQHQPPMSLVAWRCLRPSQRAANVVSCPPLSLPVVGTC